MQDQRSLGHFLRHINRIVESSRDLPLPDLLHVASMTFHAAASIYFEATPTEFEAVSANGIRLESVPSLPFSSPGSGALRELSTPILFGRLSLSKVERSRLKVLLGSIVIPLIWSGLVRGLVVLVPTRRTPPLKTLRADPRLRLLLGLSRLAYDDYTLQQRLRYDISNAADVQRHLLPELPLAHSSADVAIFSRPAFGVSGDFYDCRTLSEDRLALAVGDVAGKGIAAALVMSNCMSLLRREVEHWKDDLASLFHTINRLVFEATPSAAYVTMFYAHYDPRHKTLHYVNAGHQPSALFLRRGSPPRPLTVGGPVLGLIKSLQKPHEVGKVYVDSGDMLIVATDGVTDAHNLVGEIWDQERLTSTTSAIFERANNISGEEMVQGIASAVDSFSVGTQQFDDQTIMATTFK